MTKTNVKVHWENPWVESAVPVPIEELAEAMAGGMIAMTRDGQEEIIPCTAEFLLTNWRRNGELLDAYIIPQRKGWPRISVGIRFSNDGPDYLSPYARNQKQVAALARKYMTKPAEES